MGKGRRRASTGVSLFPILAVLICALGALIVLLLSVVQQAKVQAHTIAAANQPKAAPAGDAPKLQQLREQEEDERWRGELLEEQRKQLAEKLSAQRLELSHLEDHIRRIEDQGESLRKQAEQLEALGQMNAQERAAEEKKLAEARAALDAARSELEQARQEIAGRPPAYAIIPYEGPQGVRRRPIYVECGDLGVVLQPEGVTLVPNDFSGPLGPGNPLDAAFLAVREYWTAHGLTQPGEAYPLLIVRPDGAVAYAMCRMAMKSWEDEFGYELIDAEMKIAYPPPDPALKAVLERAVADARQRQAVFASAAPSRYRLDRPGAMRASPGAGFVPRGEGAGAAGPAGTASARGGRGVGRGAGDGNGLAGGERFSDQHGPLSEPYDERFDEGGSSTPAGKKGPRGASSKGYARGGGSAGQAGGGAGPGGASGGPTAAAQGAAGATGDISAGGAFSGGAGGASAQGYASNAGPRPGMMQEPVSPLAETRGADWGLPDDSAEATGFTRPIRLGVFPDRLVLYPERGDDRPVRNIALTGTTREGVDQLVEEIWKHIESWGIAGRRAYWKPVLRLETAPGAGDRASDLEILLRGSGIEVERK
jgi:hypothetical protein